MITKDEFITQIHEQMWAKKVWNGTSRGQKFIDKIQFNELDKCWLWTGCVEAGFNNGYGKFGIDGKCKAAHKIAYESVYGVVESGLVLDHVLARGCTNRHCVNPNHLEVVTHRINILRGQGASAKNAVKTECPNGHPLVEGNIVPGVPFRLCAKCTKTRNDKYSIENREYKNEYMRSRYANLTEDQLIARKAYDKARYDRISKEIGRKSHRPKPNKAVQSSPEMTLEGDSPF